LHGPTPDKEDGASEAGGHKKKKASEAGEKVRKNRKKFQKKRTDSKERAQLTGGGCRGCPSTRCGKEKKKSKHFFWFIPGGGEGHKEGGEK